MLFINIQDLMEKDKERNEILKSANKAAAERNAIEEPAGEMMATFKQEQPFSHERTEEKSSGRNVLVTDIPPKQDKRKKPKTYPPGQEKKFSSQSLRCAHFTGSRISARVETPRTDFHSNRVLPPIRASENSKYNNTENSLLDMPKLPPIELTSKLNYAAKKVHQDSPRGAKTNSEGNTQNYGREIDNKLNELNTDVNAKKSGNPKSILRHRASSLYLKKSSDVAFTSNDMEDEENRKINHKIWTQNTHYNEEINELERCPTTHEKEMNARWQLSARKNKSLADGSSQRTPRFPTLGEGNDKSAWDTLLMERDESDYKNITEFSLSLDEMKVQTKLNHGGATARRQMNVDKTTKTGRKGLSRVASMPNLFHYSVFKMSREEKDSELMEGEVCRLDYLALQRGRRGGICEEMEKHSTEHGLNLNELRRVLVAVHYTG